MTEISSYQDSESESARSVLCGNRLFSCRHDLLHHQPSKVPGDMADGR